MVFNQFYRSLNEKNRIKKDNQCKLRNIKKFPRQNESKTSEKETVYSNMAVEIRLKMTELCQKWRKICKNAVIQSTRPFGAFNFGVVDNSDMGLQACIPG